MNKGRLEAFSDGVFSIAITLLVLSIQVPELKHGSDGELRQALFAAFPQLLPYVTSFATIGIIWLNHHMLFQPVEQVEHTTLTLNLFLLLVVSFIPFPTAVLSRYGAQPSAAFLYGLTLTLLGASYSLLSSHLRRHCVGLAHKTGPTSILDRVRNTIGSIVYPVATVISLWVPRVSVACYFLLAVFYFIPVFHLEKLLNVDSTST